MYVPDKGDIVSIDFDPSAGKEIMKRRPAYVISQKLFNEALIKSMIPLAFKLFCNQGIFYKGMTGHAEKK